MELLCWYTVWYPYYLQYNLILEPSQKITNTIFYMFAERNIGVMILFISSFLLYIKTSALLCRPLSCSEILLPGELPVIKH